MENLNDCVFDTSGKHTGAMDTGELELEAGMLDTVGKRTGVLDARELE